MTYTELSVQVEAEFRDIVVAELSRFHYESFVETDDGVNAYCLTQDFSEIVLQDLVSRYQSQFPVQYSFQEIEQQNWNEEWEKNFQPLIIRDKVSVRASFHPLPDHVKYDIIINPKMSFGTGHHETTSLMLGLQLDLDHRGKNVLDMGCGTGILAIFACQLGASRVLAVDIEDWTVENARENAQINHCQNIEVRLGDVTALDDQTNFDIILANINRNVLLADMHRYAALLPNGTDLLLSGFYEEDVAIIEAEAKRHGLARREMRSQNRWTALHLTKTA